LALAILLAGTLVGGAIVFHATRPRYALSVGESVIRLNTTTGDISSCRITRTSTADMFVYACQDTIRATQ
jgi:hypothetical protein